jgi:recombination protein RecA
VAKSNCTVIFINQIRMKIGVVFGNPETTTGGNALKFYSSVRVEVRKAAQIKKGEEIVGNRVKVKIVKNKVAPPFRTTEFDIMYNEGISASGDILDTAVKYEAIVKKGNSYGFGENKLGVGREAAKQTIKDDAKLAKEITKEINKKLKEITA